MLQLDFATALPTKTKIILYDLIRLKTTGEGPRLKKTKKPSKVILEDLVEIEQMLKSASKNIIPSLSYDFSKIAICLQLLQYLSM